MKVYPNPSSGQFTVDLTAVGPSAGESGELRLVDGKGRLAWSAKGTADTERVTVNLATLPAGVYALSLVTKERVMTKLLVIR